MKDARWAAIAAITDVDGGAMAQDSLSRHLSCLGPEDKKFCSDMVYGTLRSRVGIQQILARFLKQPSKLPAAMKIALEIAVYSMRFQSNVPDYAAVNETIRFVKKRFGQRLANVANGVLRAITREGSDPLKLDRRGDMGLDEIASYYSLPRDIAKHWINAYGGENALLLAKRSLERPHSCLRLNPRHSASERLLAAIQELPNVKKIGCAGFAFPPGYLPRRLLKLDLDYWQRKGAISFQSAAAQLVLDKLGIYDAWQDALIWDACAGIGGKSLAMLERGLNVTLASDANWKRLKLLPSQCRRLDLPRPAVALADAIFPPLKIWEGNILVDAPCSGLGVLARRPDIKARWSIGNTDKLIRLQQDMLDSIYSVLAPGYELCYITCTLNPAENEKQIERLLCLYPDLKLLHQWQTPHEHPWLEGMFGVRLKKQRE